MKTSMFLTTLLFADAVAQPSGQPNAQDVENLYMPHACAQDTPITVCGANTEWRVETQGWASETKRCVFSTCTDCDQPTAGEVATRYQAAGQCGQGASTDIDICGLGSHWTAMTGDCTITPVEIVAGTDTITITNGYGLFEASGKYFIKGSDDTFVDDTFDDTFVRLDTSSGAALSSFDGRGQITLVPGSGSLTLTWSHASELALSDCTILYEMDGTNADVIETPGSCTVVGFGIDFQYGVQLNDFNEDLALVWATTDAQTIPENAYFDGAIKMCLDSGHVYCVPFCSSGSCAPSVSASLTSTYDGLKIFSTGLVEDAGWLADQPPGQQVNVNLYFFETKHVHLQTSDTARTWILTLTFNIPPSAKCNTLTSASTPSLADVCGPSSAYTGALVGTGTADCAGETCTYTDRTTCCAQKPCTGSCAYKCTVASDQRLSGGTEPQLNVNDANCQPCKTDGGSSWPCTVSTNCVCAVAEPCTSSCSGSCGAHPYLHPHPRSTCTDGGVTNDNCNACKASQLWPCNSPGCCDCWG